MSSSHTGSHPEDLPWNDVPADSDSVPGTAEPDPAEVVGDGDDARDLTARPIHDPNQRESLDERLAEEEPDQTDPVEKEDLPAEEAATHIVDDDRI